MKIYSRSALLSLSKEQADSLLSQNFLDDLYSASSEDRTQIFKKATEVKQAYKNLVKGLERRRTNILFAKQQKNFPRAHSVSDLSQNFWAKAYRIQTS